MEEHYYSAEQNSKFTPKIVNTSAAGISVPVYTAGGVFSSEKLDIGSKLLIEHSLIRKDTKVLDLGCGYGIVGINIKLRNPTIDLWLSDTNSRAIQLTQMNLELNKIAGTAVQSDSFSEKSLDKMQFDTILLNPPQTAGRDVCIKLMKDSYEHLNPKGFLQIVARHNKGGEYLSKKMEEIFGTVKEIAKKSGFRVYVSQKK